jgi:CRP-like cAMP-binding protein
MSDASDIIDKLPLQHFASGATVLDEGGRPGTLYFLETGTVEVSKGGVAITRVKERGAVFGEMAVLLGVPHTATVRALTDASFRVAADAGGFLREHACISAYVATILAQRLNALNKYLVDVKSQFKDQAGHVAMVDSVLETLMTKHPRSIPRRPQAGP